MDLDKMYWTNKYATNYTPWEINGPSPPLMSIMDQQTNYDMSVCIPGSGTSCDAAALISKGFRNVTVIDIAQNAIELSKEKYKEEYEQIEWICSDIFDHNNTYDIILEQTFFCAFQPSQRDALLLKISSLLNKGGIYTGVLFNVEFEQNGPPFGGNIEIYKSLFKKYFDIIEIYSCKDSIQPRLGKEVYFRCQNNI